jgi:hypothetical protein
MKYLFALMVAFLFGGLAQAAPLVDISPWRAGASDNVVSNVSNAPTRIEYRFNSAGYAFIVHDLDFRAADNYEIEIPIRGNGAGNHLEIKFADASGDNVWWVRRENFSPSNEWQVIKIKPRHVSFAWGPIADRTFKHAARMEIVIVKTVNGAQEGNLEIGDIKYTELPLPLPESTPITANQPQVLDNSDDTYAQISPPILVDLGFVREFGGIRLNWHGAAPSEYWIETSKGGNVYTLVKTIKNSDGNDDWISLGEHEARYVKISANENRQLAEISTLGLDFASDRNKLVQAMAASSARGNFPRSMSGEQSYWTVIGVKGGGSRSGLISEDGDIELYAQGPSLVPSIHLDDRTLNWSNVSASQSLVDGDLPMPIVTWRADNISIKISAIGFGHQYQPLGLARYEITNHGAVQQQLNLRLSLQPFQVNPPTQFLNRHGGVANTESLRFENNVTKINSLTRLFSLTPPTKVTSARVGAVTTDAASVTDPDGLAQMFFDYEMSLAPNETKVVLLVFAMAENSPTSASIEAMIAGQNDHARFAARIENQMRNIWTGELSKTRLTMPDDTPPIAQTLRLSQAYQLILLDDNLLKPGARSYDRSWIRDGAMMGEGLMRTGHFDIALNYFKTYSPFVFPSGKVPCCVDARGSDPVAENDSHGEFMWLYAELLRYGWNHDEARSYWPQIRHVFDYQSSIIAPQRTEEFRIPERIRLYGLLPPSISHEGYSDKPAYSYWDNFWGLKGYRGAAMAARILHETQDFERMNNAASEFATDIRNSLYSTAAFYGHNYLSGAADRGDFDPTSTTIGITAGGEIEDFPQNLLFNTFDRYFVETLQKRQTTPEVYTPYELRSVAAFLRLKQPERARAALNMFFEDQTPSAWYQWAEVITTPRRTEKYLGDLPHGWVMSDYLRSALDLFAYERQQARQIVLLAGFDPKWAELGDTKLENLYTPYGRVNLKVRAKNGGIEVTLRATEVPEGGYVIDAKTLFGGRDVRVSINQRNVEVPENGEIILMRRRATIQITEK